MTKEESITWFKHVTGPAGALVIAIFGIYFLGKFIDKMATRHFAVIDEMVEEQKEARKQDHENMMKVSNNLNELTLQIEKLKDCCKEEQN